MFLFNRKYETFYVAYLLNSFAYLQKFMFYVLKSSEVLEVLVPILYHLNDARADQCKLYTNIYLLCGILNYKENSKLL